MSSGGSGALGDGVGLATIRYPADRGSIGQRRETLDGHLISHHEGRVEPDTELANQGLGVLALLLQRLCEGRGAAASDGAEMLRGFLAAVSPMPSSSIVMVPASASALTRMLGSPSIERRSSRCSPTKRALSRASEALLTRLPEEDLPIRVQRVSHEVKNLPNIGFEAVGAHGCPQENEVERAIYEDTAPDVKRSRARKSSI